MRSINFVLIFLSVFSIGCKNNLEDIPKISKGTISENWQYHNETMKFKLQLPRDWSFVDNRRGISNFLPMSENLSENILGNEEVTISKNFNFADESSIYQLFSISKNTLEDIKSGDRKGDLGFAVISSQNGNAEEDIESAKKDILAQLNENPEAYKLNEENLKIKDNLSFGKKDKIPYFRFTIADINGNATGNRMYAFKNYGKYNLVILITYFTEEELNTIKNLVESIEN